MATCPQCQRPVAVARARCLYCGAALDPELLPVAPASSAPEPVPPAEPRAVVLIDTNAADAETLARTLGVSALEAGQRANRGWQLHRILSAEQAAHEVSRLEAAGLRARSLPETDTRPSLHPCVAEGGRRAAACILLRTDRGPLDVRREDVLVVVAGPIHRELQRQELPRGRLSRTLEPGFRFHVHLRGDPRPIEIDPNAFAFDEPRHPPTSSWLEIQGWLEELAGAGALDDGFRFMIPALGMAAPPAPADLTRALGARRKKQNDAGPAVLDNLVQFRFYSGWRAGALRGGLQG